MISRRHSIHTDRFYAAIESPQKKDEPPKRNSSIKKLEYIFSYTREDSDDQGSVLELEAEELDALSPIVSPTAPKKKNKWMNKLKKSKQRRKKNGNDESQSGGGSPGDRRSHSEKGGSKRKGTKKPRRKSDPLGVVIVSDTGSRFDDCSFSEEYDSSAHMSAHTEPTVLIEDDCTYTTEGTKEELPKKSPKRGRRPTKRTKSKDRSEKRYEVSLANGHGLDDRKKPKVITERRRPSFDQSDYLQICFDNDKESLHGRTHPKKESNDGNRNMSWGDTDPIVESENATLSPELVTLLMGTAPKRRSSWDPSKISSESNRSNLKKSSSLDALSKSTSPVISRRGSVGNLVLSKSAMLEDSYNLSDRDPRPTSTREFRRSKHSSRENCNRRTVVRSASMASSIVKSAQDRHTGKRRTNLGQFLSNSPVDCPRERRKGRTGHVSNSSRSLYQEQPRPRRVKSLCKLGIPSTSGTCHTDSKEDYHEFLSPPFVDDDRDSDEASQMEGSGLIRFDEASQMEGSGSIRLSTSAELSDDNNYIRQPTRRSSYHSFRDRVA